MPVSVILLAAGSGSRFDRKKPKQFLKLKNKYLFEHSLDVFLGVADVREVVLVVADEFVGWMMNFAAKKKTSKRLLVVRGGAFRGESVKFGYEALLTAPKVILVHDAARPLVTKEIVQRVIAAAEKTGVALAAWPLPDTLKEAAPNKNVKRTVPRENLWLAQTPQGFRWNVANKCLKNPDPKATDDVALAEKKGFRVMIVEGAPTNIKLTTPQDLKLCETFLK